jgi:hypothetical protein
VGTVRPVAGFPESAGMVPTSGCGGRVLSDFVIVDNSTCGPVWTHFFDKNFCVLDSFLCGMVMH